MAPHADPLKSRPLVCVCVCCDLVWRTIGVHQSCVLLMTLVDCLWHKGTVLYEVCGSFYFVKGWKLVWPPRALSLPVWTSWLQKWIGWLVSCGNPVSCRNCQLPFPHPVISRFLPLPSISVSPIKRMKVAGEATFRVLYSSARSMLSVHADIVFEISWMTPF